VYGTQNLPDIQTLVEQRAAELGAEVEFAQSNSEGDLVTLVGRAADRFEGVLINPAGYTHTSVALLDAIRACGLPCIEVHMTNIHGREDFRRRSITAAGCQGQISGLGAASYVLGVEGLVGLISEQRGRTA